MTNCPRCSVGVLKGGTGCIFCPVCQSVYLTNMQYLYTYKTDDELKQTSIVGLYENILGK